MDDVEAGTRMLKLLQAGTRALGERQMKTVLRSQFRKMEISNDDFDKALRFATEKGWITQNGMMVELTEAGLNLAAI